MQVLGKQKDKKPTTPLYVVIFIYKQTLDLYFLMTK